MLKYSKVVLKTLKETGARLTLKKCCFAQKQTEWMRFKLSEKGIKALAGRILAITDKIKSETQTNSWAL